MGGGGGGSSSYTSITSSSSSSCCDFRDALGGGLIIVTFEWFCMSCRFDLTLSIDLDLVSSTKIDRLLMKLRISPLL